ncbi:MAG: GNAT family N-acetyltransferase [Candidatus Heimdallarchaeota archaeon]|nr:GNAT family N-acetyltransferase [Candidatus Heimdallarchaeota archaeon]
MEVHRSVFPHCEKNVTEKQFEIFTSASFYNPELDMIVVASDGKFAAFSTFRMDPVSGIVELEPVGTHPNHQKLGLASAAISEGLQHLKKYKPILVCSSGAAATPAANRLYDSLGFSQKMEIHQWQKKL